MKMPYGFAIQENDIKIHVQHAKVVQTIYQLYLQGHSLGRITEYLSEQGILSPTGKEKWTRAAIDKILGNRKYLCQIIPLEQFAAVQEEKDKRTNVTENKKRKANRYRSSNSFGSHLFCGCCGKSLRRITRASGEVVWRCADRVENGKAANCDNRKSISDETLIQL